jgi:hypothetical protein
MKKRVPAKLDFDHIAQAVGPEHNITVSPRESPEDRRARNDLDRTRFLWRQVWTGVGIAALAVVTVWLFRFVEHSDANIGQWARAGVLSTVTAGVGFIAGRLSARD